MLFINVVDQKMRQRVGENVTSSCFTLYFPKHIFQRHELIPNAKWVRERHENDFKPEPRVRYPLSQIRGRAGGKRKRKRWKLTFAKKFGEGKISLPKGEKKNEKIHLGEVDMRWQQHFCNGFGNERNIRRINTWRP